jgi:hypothetical protein
MSTEPRFSTEAVAAASPKPAHIEAFEANMNAEWAETFAKLGLSVVVIQVQRGGEAFKNPSFYETLAAEVSASGLGQYDSSQWQPHIRHFFHIQTKRLAEGLEFLKSGLDRRGVLPWCAIGYLDVNDNLWRQFHPAIEP